MLLCFPFSSNHSWFPLFSSYPKSPEIDIASRLAITILSRWFGSPPARS